MFTLTDSERYALRLTNYLQACAVLTFVAVLMGLGYLPTGVLI